MYRNRSDSRKLSPELLKQHGVLHAEENPVQQLAPGTLRVTKTYLNFVVAPFHECHHLLRIFIDMLMQAFDDAQFV
ncbi:hypothetical protein S2091_0833 [Solimicrobium silvestre]|uniref:Uncharacterized protein n=1 Tax=Solimicrobium silvestre TaxID=2099400 RepID=A0A2S9H2K1_9BURK|nr:hypothetical protein S2091_0833 [Solimicrobium silvestre]